MAASVAWGWMQPAAAQDLLGSYLSADGRVLHRFNSAADYTATVRAGSHVLTFKGVYQEGRNVCLLSGPDPRKGGAGNVLLYVGENRCCLAFRPIADKMLVTKVGMEGDRHGPGYFLCNDQMLRLTSVGQPLFPPEPPYATSTPRTLLPPATP